MGTNWEWVGIELEKPIYTLRRAFGYEHLKADEHMNEHLITNSQSNLSDDTIIELQNVKKTYSMSGVETHALRGESED